MDASITKLKTDLKVKWATIKLEEPESDGEEEADVETYKFIKDYFFICGRLDRYILLYMLMKLRFITG